MTGGHEDLGQQPPESPFDSRLPGKRSRATRLVIYGTVVLASVVMVYLMTRGASAKRSGDDEVESMEMGASDGDSARLVMLSVSAAERIGVTYAVVTAGPLSREIRTVGQVTYDETRVKAVTVKVDGWVERLFVNSIGQPVRRGEPLLSIYSPMLVTAQEELLLAKRLRSDVSNGTPDAVRSAETLLASARRRLLYWDVPPSEVDRVERTGDVQRALTLLSPVGGFVMEKSVLAGQKIMAGDPLYQVTDLSVVWVEGEVFEQDLGAVHVGQAVTAELEAFQGEPWLGRIAYIHPILSAETRTARVRVELPNPGLRLKPGMYATLLVRGTSRGDVLSIPRSAVLVTGERRLVFVKRADGMLEPREVAVGLTTNDRIEVRGGVAAGDTVVASATFLVDAESNLESALGGMGNMPGMDITAPASKDRPPPALPAPAAKHEEHRE